jgi:hypothetical protein
MLSLDPHVSPATTRSKFNAFAHVDSPSMVNNERGRRDRQSAARRYSQNRKLRESFVYTCRWGSGSRTGNDIRVGVARGRKADSESDS